MANDQSDELKLHDGMVMPIGLFQSNRQDTMFFVFAGGALNLSFNGRPRMALVPLDVAQAYLDAKEAHGLSASAFKDRVTRALGLGGQHGDDRPTPAEVAEQRFATTTQEDAEFWAGTGVRRFEVDGETYVMRHLPVGEHGQSAVVVLDSNGVRFGMFGAVPHVERVEDLVSRARGVVAAVRGGIMPAVETTGGSVVAAFDKVVPGTDKKVGFEIRYLDGDDKAGRYELVRQAADPADDAPVATFMFEHAMGHEALIAAAFKELMDLTAAEEADKAAGDA